MTWMVWRHTLLSFPRMRESSTPRLFGSITGVSGILDRPPSRAMTTEYAPAFSRQEMPEVFISFRTSKKSEGAGNAGCALHPRSHAQVCTRSARMSIQGSGEHPTFPAQWLYGLLRALPGDRLSCHHRLHASDPIGSLRNICKLDASTGASGPHDFTVRSRAVRFRHYQRPPQPVPRSWRS